MHALGQFISELMDARNMTRPDLERTSGLSRQHIHQLLDDRRTRLGRMIDNTTITGLARAFPDIGDTAFIIKAAESMGVPVDRLATIDIDTDRLSNDALLGILARRLQQATPPPLQVVGERPSHDPPDDPTPLAARHGHRTREHLDHQWDHTDTNDTH